MKVRSYQGGSDIRLLQDFNAAAIAVTGGCGYLHPGDIPLRLFNGNKFYDPSEVLTIWEDSAGVAAWLMVQPGHKSFDAQVRPDLRESGLERDILLSAEEWTGDSMRRHQIESEALIADAFQADTIRANLLIELGWELDSQANYILNRARLVDIPEPRLPAGCRIRSAKGVEEAGALAGVHAASFGSAWTPELYRRVMESPGYAARPASRSHAAAKLASTRSPAGPLRSGWNCTPTAVPRRATAVNGLP